ncbi:MAG: EF-hand domain-containing protein, partial [Pirellulales bacterium]|nr:EF-hand domain-containing protein [Pirellulales bacterium]
TAQHSHLMRSAKEKNMNKPTITTIITLFFCFSAFAQEAKGKDWTEEEWKKEKGSYGWVFPHIDKNADGQVTAVEYAEFQNYKKKHPNWESELKPKAVKSEKTETEPLVTKAPETNAGIPQGIEALEASLNKERMVQAVEMFEKLDKNKDGKITVPEVPVEQFKKKVWVQANLNGDMILTWEEELIWQYNFQKKKAKPEGKAPTPRKGGSGKPTSVGTGSGSPAWVGDRFSTDIPEYKADQPLELLSPEVELAIMKKLHAYDKIMNIQLLPSNAREDEQADDVTGEWLIFTTMTHGQGMHKLTLKQQGEDISCAFEKLIYGPYPWIDSGVLDRLPPADSGKLRGDFAGRFIKSESKHNLFYLHRANSEGPFEAIFSAVLSVDGQTATGTLVNTSGMHGMMLMVRREALSRYKHLLESDTAQQTELAGAKPPLGAGVDDMPKGVKALEAALNEERMAQAVEMFEELDKNKDGKITDQEVPAKKFENKVWIQANLNGDMILTWEEELIWQYNFQRKKSKQK